MTQGRPTKYTANMAALVYWIARAGLTDALIAKELGVSERTLYNWQKAHPEFAEALRAGKEDPDDKVEAALYKRALGYEYTEEKVTAEHAVITKIERTTKQVVPDVTACIFWLKNRRPDTWKDRHDVGVTTPVTVIFPESMKEPECGNDNDG